MRRGRMPWDPERTAIVCRDILTPWLMVACGCRSECPVKCVARPAEPAEVVSSVRCWCPCHS